MLLSINIFGEDIWMFLKIGVLQTPKMDGENNEKPDFFMDDLGGFAIFLVQHPYSATKTYPTKHRESK